MSNELERDTPLTAEQRQNLLTVSAALEQLAGRLMSVRTRREVREAFESIDTPEIRVLDVGQGDDTERDQRESAEEPSQIAINRPCNRCGHSLEAHYIGRSCGAVIDDSEPTTYCQCTVFEDAVDKGSALPPESPDHAPIGG
jgi:hypothetical protein